jgi:CheY-like chemotaxis protein
MTLDAAEAGRIGGLHPGEYVRLTVRDTGHGMSSEVLHRIYDPFFTTKGPGEGTGLGLSVVHGIVISHGGALHVDSVPGVGTRFDMYFPRTEAIRRHSPAGGIPVETGSEHVLFVDDEEHIAELGRRILERLGYQVTAETSSVRARERFETHPDSFDVIVTDQTMPRLTGLELAHEARRIRPEVPVVLTTGFSESVTTERLIQEGIAALVMKPYGGADLARAVRDALHRARTTSPR